MFSEQSCDFRRESDSRHFSPHNQTDRLQAAMAAAGMPYTGKSPLRIDGSFNRWHDNGRKGGPLWCVAYELTGGHLAAVFGDWRVASRCEFKSWQEADDIPPETARQYTEELERRQHLTEEAESRNRAQAAKRAAEFWQFLPETGTSEYLERKQVGAHGIRYGADEYGRFIAVPMRNIHNTFKGFQRVYDSGLKRFSKHTEKKGCFHTIGTLDPTGDLYLAEGYATAASIHEATGKPVVVCFDAGNLLSVTTALKSVHPDLQLVVCADNDAWKAAELGPDGKPKGNTGIRAAYATARAHSGTRVGIPNFINLDTSSQPTDFNDLARLAGIEHVKRQLGQARAPRPQAVEGAGRDQAAPGRDAIELILNEKSGHPRAIAFNIQEVLTKDERWLGCFGYDEFNEVPVLLRRPPYDLDKGDWTPRGLENSDDTRTAIWLQGEYRLCIMSSLVSEVVEVVARRNRFHPVRDYLNSLEWDGTPRLDTWLHDCFGAPDSAYVRAVSSKALIAAVARVYRPGCKVDSILITEGPQGIGKSRAWRILAGEFFSDSLPDMHSKDALVHLAGSWIVELSELSALSRSETEAVKRFISSPIDRYRPPYGRREVKRSRQCVFVGSTNEQAYLKDSTGNRRFWPVPTSRPCDIDKLKSIRDQLWAEALYRFRQGEPWHLSPELELQAAAAQAERLELDPWEDVILPYLAARPDLSFVSTETLFADVLKIEDARDWTLPNTKRLAGLMRRHGWKSAKQRVGGKEMRGYKRPPPSPPPKPDPAETLETLDEIKCRTENSSKNNAETLETLETLENKHFENNEVKNDEKHDDCKNKTCESVFKKVTEDTVASVSVSQCRGDMPEAAPPKLSSDAKTLLGLLAAYRGFEQAELLAKRLRWHEPEGVTRVLRAAVELQSAGLAVVSNGAVKPVRHAEGLP